MVFWEDFQIILFPKSLFAEQVDHLHAIFHAGLPINAVDIFLYGVRGKEKLVFDIPAAFPAADQPDDLLLPLCQLIFLEQVLY